MNRNKDLNLINFKKHHSIFTIAFSLYLYLTPFRLQQGDIDEDVLLLIIKKVLLGASIFFQRSKSWKKYFDKIVGKALDILAQIICTVSETKLGNYYKKVNIQVASRVGFFYWFYLHSEFFLSVAYLTVVSLVQQSRFIVRSQLGPSI